MKGKYKQLLSFVPIRHGEEEHQVNQPIITSHSTNRALAVQLGNRPIHHLWVVLWLVMICFHVPVSPCRPHHRLVEIFPFVIALSEKQQKLKDWFNTKVKAFSSSMFKGH